MNRRDAVIALGALGVALPLGAHAQAPATDYADVAVRARIRAVSGNQGIARA